LLIMVPATAGACRVSWRVATLFFHTISKKIRIEKKIGYVYVLDDIATANGEVGICGSRSSP
jgi:hypothetical protein